ncbi:MAG TPA: sugar phosphate isomerase/epimerase [Terriglobia bacterium]|nr:sugar phosphate isomerase/epimerase [Terriglobia bacterium]
MSKQTDLHVVSRREFLAATGGALASAPGVLAATRATSAPSDASPGAPADAPTKIPIGVFDPIFFHLSLDAMLEKMTALGLEAIEVAVGGYPSTPHCPVADMLADAAKARAWRKKFEDRNIRIGAFSAHGNPLHPKAAAVARRDDEAFRRAILLAERLDVPVVVGFSGCPGDSDTSQHPNWLTYRWPDDYQEVVEWQWKEKVIPYWQEMVKFARQHGVRKLAFEMHPGFVVYNPWTLLRLREAAGEEIGANNDLSHLFWQGCDPVEVIRLLAKEGALFHAHMKDTVILQENVAKFGILNFVPGSEDFRKGSMTFRAVGYGHGAEVWKQIVAAYMDVGYQGILSIENEDPILNGEDGVERAAYVLKNVRAELLNGKA